MNSRSLLAWVPTLYFFEGIPYFLVNVVSVTLFKRLGMDNASLAALTSLLYLPWVIKPLWSPLVDIYKTKRWWILTMQAALTLSFAVLALSLPHSVGRPVSAFVPSLIIFYIAAMLSATHDIAADGFYMLSLSEHHQSLFVGIRSTFYRISSVFGQGVIVVVAGLLETRYGNIPKAWSYTLLGSSFLLLLLSVWHFFALPRKEDVTACADGSAVKREGLEENSIGNDVKSSCKDVKSEGSDANLYKSAGKSFGDAFGSFFRKPGILLAMLFLLFFRLPEAFCVKMLTPFMLDPVSVGGLGLSTTQSGLVYGTVGVIALTIGGISGGIFASRVGLRKALWPMALSLALPCAVYLYMAIVQPAQIWVVYLCVSFDQFGYGFGFTAYLLYMIYFSEGEYKTSHYAICTAFMALSMMVPGFFAGWLQSALGYVGFFVLVMICCLATITLTALLVPHIRPDYGKK